ncbi:MULTISPECIES: YchJ family protein [unclassified Nocardiopsis]|uniref:YchJ family protein n=1 Tax=unclassified Nocardiopsis TaxID=2649073 RepID=UPI0013576C84|nr:MULTISPECIES: YchJ family metal-binding protein [unclassified Nocardiopsis]
MPHHRPPRTDDGAPCPCGGPGAYRDCCAPLHRGGERAATAERLMRSRYSAFAVGDRDYLLRSWHPDTRPQYLDLDPATVWRRLEVLSTTGGTPFHNEGTVAFRAVYRENGREGALEEHSRFTRHGGNWVYLDALPG